MTLEECKTVEEVEALQCNACATNHHWGWCDMPSIKCVYKDKIKEILGIPPNQHSTSFEENLRQILSDKENKE